ncbi:hypothetical protein ACFYZ8_14840 [Streptomyces sp. NPDC001668]|uniref:hypothetical protein n=1 Tax=unclassified Streptomyces TaxID=2593676 RepID=UPI00340F817C
MAPSHSIDPRAFDDPRNRYPTDEEFYASDRPLQHVLPEDRPRGGPSDPIRHPWGWGMIAFVVFACLIVLMGVALAP